MSIVKHVDKKGPLHKKNNKTLVYPSKTDYPDQPKHDQQNVFYLCEDSLVVRSSASGEVGRGFVPRSRHTKGVKNGTSSSLADARIKRVVLGR